MRRIGFPVVLILLGLTTACVSNESKSALVADSLRCDRFVQKMDTGQTTRLQEQAFIRANRKAFHVLDYDVNGNPLPSDLVPVTSGH